VEDIDARRGWHASLVVYLRFRKHSSRLAWFVALKVCSW
jgi:hypothetical protein